MSLGRFSRQHRIRNTIGIADGVRRSMGRRREEATPKFVIEGCRYILASGSRCMKPVVEGKLYCEEHLH